MDEDVQEGPVRCWVPGRPVVVVVDHEACSKSPNDHQGPAKVDVMAGVVL
jgi:hypothetical protein